MEIASVEGGPALSAIGIDGGIDAARVLQQHHRHRVLGAPERQGGCLEAGGLQARPRLPAQVAGM